jgi:shikimate dehydrogenase
MKKSRQFGLIGKNISYSFSKTYFSKKFEELDLTNCCYENFDLETLDSFLAIINNNPNLQGLNVTIPYKETIIPYLDCISKKATIIGAVNTIRFTKKGTLKGYNTDYFGFKKALEPLLESHHKSALILGTGGASKAVAFALKQLGIAFTFVSREATEDTIGYNAINAATFDDYQIIINCTPLGTSPNVTVCPTLPYAAFTSKHLAFDLIYNPEETLFLKKAKENGAVIKNGMEMLVFQAENAWNIWNK